MQVSAAGDRTLLLRSDGKALAIGDTLPPLTDAELQEMRMFHTVMPFPVFEQALRMLRSAPHEDFPELEGDRKFVQVDAGHLSRPIAFPCIDSSKRSASSLHVVPAAQACFIRSCLPAMARRLCPLLAALDLLRRTRMPCSSSG